MKPSFEQAAAAATLEQFAHDLLTWATQPAEALPEGWRAAYQDRLNEVAALVRRAFAEDRQALAKLREVESEARDFIGILAANPAIAGKPVSEWPVVAFRETFERLAADRRWFADRVRVLDAAGIDGNPKVLTLTRQLQSAFAEVETFASTAAAAFAGALQPASPAIVEAPQTSPERASGPQPGSTPSDSAAGAAAPQGASGVVEWSKPRSPKVWRQMLKKLEHPPFTSETAWKENVKRDPDSFSGPANHRRITRAKAEEWGLSLPEFDRSPK